MNDFSIYNIMIPYGLYCILYFILYSIISVFLSVTWWELGFRCPSVLVIFHLFLERFLYFRPSEASFRGVFDTFSSFPEEMREKWGDELKRYPE